MESKLKILIGLVSLFLITLISTLGLKYLEGWSMFSAFWVTVTSLTMVGYGDIIPVTFGGRVFLLVILIVGVGMVTYTLVTLFTLLVEGQVSKIMQHDKTLKAIKLLENHIIVCGAGRVGSSVAHVLRAEKASYVLVDSDPDKVAELESAGHLVYEGDATEDEVLKLLGIDKARGIVAALPEDAYNLFIALTARDVNPSLKIVARAERPETMEKLRRAGADKVISPTQLGGFQLAMAMIKPVTVDMVETLFTVANQQLQLEELLVTENSPLVDKEIKDVFGREDSKVRVIAIIRNTEVLMNIHGYDCIRAGDTLIMVGARNDLEKIETISYP
ncbi:MAG TPA: potassium channel protein [Syntrophomonadaceae bacterium]|nr:potassium channel protein [Syntrophomonadaceae bacterium]